MLSDDLIATIQRLPLNDKVALLESLMQTVNEELRQASPGTDTTSDAKRRTDRRGTEEPLPPFAELRGILAKDTLIPADYDWKDDYADYLTKKYA